MLDQALTLVTENLIQVVVSLFMTVLLPLVLRKLKLNIDDQTRSYMETALTNAIRYGIAHSMKNTRNAGFHIVEDPEARRKAVSIASDYVMANAPQGAKRLGLLSDDSLRKVLEARVISEAVALQDDIRHSTM